MVFDHIWLHEKAAFALIKRVALIYIVEISDVAALVIDAVAADVAAVAVVVAVAVAAVVAAVAVEQAVANDDPAEAVVACKAAAAAYIAAE